MNFLKTKVENFLLKLKIPFIQKLYWESQAKFIDENWGEQSSDFEVLEYVINEVKPQRMLEFGCGSGRPFKLYKQLHIPELYGYDISEKAVFLSKKKNPDYDVNYVTGDFYNLKFSDNYFDLTLSTKVLSAVLPSEINKTVKEICRISKNVYLNESLPGEHSETNYWFIHDLDTLMADNGFVLIDNGSIKVQSLENVYQTWRLYKKNA